jgi:V/A-type H+-transporting ATPase subunit C
MAGEYDYGSARLRAMKSRLFKLADYETLLTHESLDDVISSLAQSTYRAEIEAALVRYGGVRCVTEALRVNFAHTLSRIKTFFRGEARRLLGILLTRWDVFNLKTILRGLARGVPAEEILEVLVPAGELDEVALTQLAQQPDVRAMVDLMVTWRLPYAWQLATSMPAYVERGDLAELELALDRFHHTEVLRSLTGATAGHRKVSAGGRIELVPQVGQPEDYNVALVWEMIEVEIDIANILALLRLCHVPDWTERIHARYGVADASPLLIPGGQISGETLARLSLPTSVDDVVGGLANTPYGSLLQPLLEAYHQTLDLTPFQRELDRHLVRLGVGTFRREPLSLAPAIGYIWAKQAEVTNLRLIAHGKALGMDRDAIRRELFVV